MLGDLSIRMPLCISEEVDAMQSRDVAIDHLSKHAKDGHNAGAPRGSKGSTKNE